MKYHSILLFGAPGVGKGTQGKILGAIPHFFHCACGDVFRSLRHDSPLGKVFIRYSSHGQLVPDEPTVELWRDFIHNTTKIGRYKPEQDFLVLDGIPRNRAQAEILRDTLDVAAIFYLKCADEAKLVERVQRRALKETRLDDASLQVIRDRLNIYARETEPVLEFYGSRLVHEINADQPPVKVLADILQYVVKL